MDSEDGYGDSAVQWASGSTTHSPAYALSRLIRVSYRAGGGGPGRGAPEGCRVEPVDFDRHNALEPRR